MGKSSRVLVVSINYAPEPTGTAPYVEGLANELSRQGFDVRVITTFPHYPQWTFGAVRPPRRIRDVNGSVVIERYRHFLPRRPIGVGRALSEVSFGLSVIFASWGSPASVVLVSPGLFSSAMALMKAKLRRIPALVWVQDIYSVGLEETRQSKRGGRRFVNFLEGWTFKNARKLIVIHDRFVEEIQKRFRLGEDHIVVQRNWSHVDDALVFDRAAARREFGWGEGDLIALHAGNMGVKQGLDNIVSAAALAARTSSSVRFVLLGDGNQRRRLEKLARGLPNLEFIRPLPDSDFERAIRAADVLLVNELPGVSGMAVPSKLTTYFATGVPVLAATDPGSVTEHEVLSAGAGVTVPSGAPALLLARVLELSADPELSAALGESGRRFRDEYLSSARGLDRLVGIVRSVVHEVESLDGR